MSSHRSAVAGRTSIDMASTVADTGDKVAQEICGPVLDASSLAIKGREC